jgi:hypothetical protein
MRIIDTVASTTGTSRTGTCDTGTSGPSAPEQP